MGAGDDGVDDAPRRAERLDLQRGWVPMAALILAVCLPILLAVLDAARAGWAPSADAATITTRAYDMWSSHRPLVGQFSLAGSEGGQQVFSPGPLLYVVLAPAARFGPAWALPLTMALWATGCFAVALVAARRIGGWWFSVLVALGFVGVVRASGAARFVEVWNPWASLAPFAALVMVCWLTALGNRRWLVAAVVLASFMVQSHLTYLPPSLVLLAVAVIGGWWPWTMSSDDDDDDEDGGAAGRGDAARLRPALTALGAGLVCWALPLYEQVTSSPGNLSLVRSAAGDQGATFGPAIGVNVWWRASGILPAYARAASSQAAELDQLRASPGAAAWIGTVLLLALLVATAWAARRRGSHEVLVGAVIAVGLAVASVATASRIPLDRLIVASYSLRWIVTAGLVPWLVLGLAVIRFDLLRRWLPKRGIPPVVAVGAVAVVALLAVLVPRTDEAAWMSEPARTAGDALVAQTPPGARILLADSGRYEVIMTPALAWRLRRAGQRPVLVRDIGEGTGEAYAPSGEPCDAVVILRSSAEPAPAGARKIAVVPFDEPGRPDQVAVYLAEDGSPDGRC